MKRAGYWEEITDPEQNIPEGTPMRTEAGDGTAHEFILGDGDTACTCFPGGLRVFIDRDWVPKRDWVKRIGQRMTAEEIEALPIGSVLRGNSYTKIAPNKWESDEGNMFENSAMYGDFLITVGEG